jgi:hypothetical protein
MVDNFKKKHFEILTGLKLFSLSEFINYFFFSFPFPFNKLITKRKIIFFFLFIIRFLIIIKNYLFIEEEKKEKINIKLVFFFF